MITTIPGMMVIYYFRLVHQREPVSEELGQAAIDLETHCREPNFVRVQKNGILYRMSGIGRTHPRLQLLVRDGVLVGVFPESPNARRPIRADDTGH